MAENNQPPELKSIIASLESKVDLLEAELSYVHRLLLQIGFPDGINGLKLTIEELLDTDEEGKHPPPFPSAPEDEFFNDDPPSFPGF